MIAEAISSSQIPMSILSQIDVVLVEPSHPGNIGAAARSLKTMGLGSLVLVRPRRFPDEQANQRAAGAEDVLLAARVEQDLESALGDATLVLGTSVREREVNWPLLTPREAASQVGSHLASQVNAVAEQAQATKNRVCILFGREHSGLTNDELDHCSAQICIPANPDYSSLNLASAVQIVAYELRLADINAEGLSSVPTQERKPRQQAATKAQRDGHMGHLQQLLSDIDFARNENSPLLLRKLTRLYNKADLTVEEIQILRGILTAMQAHVARSKS